MVVALLVATACNPSTVDADADIVVHGDVAGDGGTLLEGMNVALMKEADAGDIFVIATSVGLACLEGTFSECGETKNATTAADGTYRFDLKGSDTQGSFGSASILELTTVANTRDGDLAGPAVSTRFQVQTENVVVPLRLWSTELTLASEGETLTATWTDPPSGVFPRTADLSTMRRWVEFVSGGDRVWRQDASDAGAEFDVRVLEDTSGGAAVFSTIGDIKTSAEQGTDVEVLQRSRRVAYRSPAGAPASRGAACQVGGVEQQPCGITDGDLVSTFGAASCPPDDAECVEPQHKRVRIDLPEPVAIELVVVRGCSGRCSVDASMDGSDWRTLGRLGDDSAAPVDGMVRVEDPQQARFVRMTSEQGVLDLREVSVWDPSGIDGSGSLVVDPDSVPPPPKAGGDGGSMTWLWIVLALVAGGAIVFVIMRRRSAEVAAGGGEAEV